MSSGPDFEFEASYANMVVANLLQKRVVRVSMLNGGYAALHEHVTLMGSAGAGLLLEHNEKRCLVCTPLPTQIAAASESVSSPAKEKEKPRSPRAGAAAHSAASGAAASGGGGTSAAPSVAAVAMRVGHSVFERIGTRASSLKSWFSAPQPEPADTTQPEQSTSKSANAAASGGKPHVHKRDAQKPYRNLKDVFSIGDEDDGTCSLSFSLVPPVNF